MRRLGIRYKRMRTDDVILSFESGIEIFDVDSDEAVDGVKDIVAKWAIDGAVEATIQIFLKAQDIK